MSVNMNSCTLDKQDCGVSCGVSCRVAGEPVGMGVEVLVPLQGQGNKIVSGCGQYAIVHGQDLDLVGVVGIQVWRGKIRKLKLPVGDSRTDFLLLIVCSP